jgi:2-succinyl-6-hydroxy-2,4-cyclohexadiene-1-carboxylate synthase
VRLLLLHGFTATGRSWDPVRRLLDAQRYPDVVAPDLRAASIDEQVEQLRQDEPYVLAGYSMGGRVALHLALAQPRLVKRLVLISTTAGIEDPRERAERRAADERLASKIERDGVEAFAQRWAERPLFADQPPDVRAAAHADRLRWTAAELAATLRGMGTGAMEPVWDRLHDVEAAAVVLAGERDAKFRAIGERLARELPRGELRVVEGAGHALHLERPQAVAAAL